MDDLKDKLIELCAYLYACYALDIEAYLDEIPDNILRVLGMTEGDIVDEIDKEIEILCERYGLDKEDYEWKN